MIFTQFSSNTPFTPPINLVLTPASTHLLTPLQLGWSFQYQMINALTWGMLDDVFAEIEHALVEGRDLTTTLVNQIQDIQGQALSQEQRQLLARARLNEAEDNLQSIIKALWLNLMQLPFTRLSGKPARKRFAVTLEGEAHTVD